LELRHRSACPHLSKGRRVPARTFIMAGHELCEHWQRLNCFVREWGLKQEQLLTSLAADKLASPLVKDAFEKARGASDGRAEANVISDQTGVALAVDSCPQWPSNSSVGLTNQSAVPADGWASQGSLFSSEGSGGASAARRKPDTPLSGDTPVHFKRRQSTQNLHFLTPPKNVTHMVHHRIFEYLSGCVIAANAFVIAASSDYAMQNPADPESSVLTGLESVFAVYYCAEVVLKMYAEGSDFWCGLDNRWNIFDVTLAVQAMFEQIERLATKDASTLQNMSFLRILRLLKMLKLLRVIRLLRTFRELRLILSSVFGCTKALTWACIMVLTTSFMFGVCILQFVAVSFADTHSEADTVTMRGMNTYWDSVSTAMLSLFMSSMGGQDWEIIAEPLKNVSSFAYGIFIVYIAFFDLAILNTISSIFFESMMSHAEKDHELAMELAMERKEEYIENLQSLYDQMDDDGDGIISFKEFCKHLENPVMRAFVSSLDIDIGDAKNFFQVLSSHGSRPVDLQAFVAGCIRLKGAARSLDLMDLMYQHAQSSRDQQTFFKKAERRLNVRLTHLESLAATRAVESSTVAFNNAVAAGMSTVASLDESYAGAPPSVDGATLAQI